MLVRSCEYCTVLNTRVNTACSALFSIVGWWNIKKYCGLVEYKKVLWAGVEWGRSKIKREGAQGKLAHRLCSRLFSYIFLASFHIRQLFLSFNVCLYCSGLGEGAWKRVSPFSTWRASLKIQSVSLETFHLGSSGPAR